jgi:hypothetical protein
VLFRNHEAAGSEVEKTLDIVLNKIMQVKEPSSIVKSTVFGGIMLKLMWFSSKRLQSSENFL